MKNLLFIMLFLLVFSIFVGCFTLIVNNTFWIGFLISFISGVLFFIFMFIGIYFIEKIT